MNKILVGTTEITVQSLRPYAYVNGKNEKFLQIKVSADSANFEELRSVLENTTETIRYFENDVLVCEYNGYGVFEAQYSNGVYEVELHKNTIVEQMNALLNVNERLTTANDALQQTSNMLVEQNDILAEQNIMLEFTMAELMEVTIPLMLEEMFMASAVHDEALAAQGEALTALGEEVSTLVDTVDSHSESLSAQGETLSAHEIALDGHGEVLSAQGEMLTTIDERLQFVEAVITAGDEEVVEGEVVEEPVTE